MIGFGGGKSWGTNTIAGYTDYTIGGTSYGGQGIVTLASGESGNGGQGVGGDSGRWRVLPVRGHLGVGRNSAIRN